MVEKEKKENWITQYLFAWLYLKTQLIQWEKNELPGFDITHVLISNSLTSEQSSSFHMLVLYVYIAQVTYKH